MTRDFTLDIEQGHVRGSFRPSTSPPRGLFVVCAEPTTPSADVTVLVDTCVERMHQMGLATLTSTLTPPRTRDHTMRIGDHATAKLETIRWLRETEFGDAGRLVVILLGIGIAALPTVEVAEQLDELRAMCLIAPTTPDAAYRMIDPSEANGEWPTSMIESLPEQNTLEQFAALDRPSLILHGAADEVVPHQVSRQFVGATLTERLVIAGAGHDLGPDPIRPAPIQRLSTFVSNTLPA